MKAAIDKLYTELNKKKIDWNGLEEYIASLGDMINAYDEKEAATILSEGYKSHWKGGSVNLRLTELFVKHGFDVKANGGKNGASCLCELCWSSYDKYVIIIAELLLKLGADSTVKCGEGEEDGVLECISWRFGDWEIGEYDSANLFVAYYEMIDRAQKGKEYAGIRAFRDCVGEIVSKVERMKVYGFEGKDVRTSYVLYCGDKHLVISDYIELIVNPYAREEAISVEDVSSEFGHLMGAKVRGLRFLNANLAKLSFDNGVAILIGKNKSANIEEPGAWFKLTTNMCAALPEEGTVVDSIKLWGNISHAERSTYYCEDTVVLNTEKGTYGLYFHGVGKNRISIRAEKIEKELVSGLKRGIRVNAMRIRHIECSGKAIKWISISCDEGMLYIVPDGFEKVALFMSEKELETDEVVCVSHFTKGLKKIKLLS